jgi:hypothetical protein
MTDDHPDRHAERRDEKHDRKVRGMRVTGKSVLLLQEIIGRRARGEKVGKGKRKARPPPIV